MSSGSAPTVLARMSLVSTSHSLSRFGYCCWELLLRGTEPEPAFTALPPIEREQPVNTSSAAIPTVTTALTLRPRRGPARIDGVIWSSQSLDEPVLWRCRRAVGTASD